jgi:hypothetical protein
MMMPWMLALLLFADLDSARNEPNLERRSELALVNAGTAMDAARDTYKAGEIGKAQTALDEVGASVDLSYDALVEAGKDPRKHPKFFKSAELKTRELLRRLEDMTRAVNMEDRAMVVKVRDSVSEVHDKLLSGIMTKRKKSQEPVKK